MYYIIPKQIKSSSAERNEAFDFENAIHCIFIFLFIFFSFSPFNVATFFFSFVSSKNIKYYKFIHRLKEFSIIILRLIAREIDESTQLSLDQLLDRFPISNCDYQCFIMYHSIMPRTFRTRDCCIWQRMKRECFWLVGNLTHCLRFGGSNRGGRVEWREMRSSSVHTLLHRNTWLG